MCIQELEVAVSLRLFTSRAAELQPRLRPFLHELPAALTAAAAAVDALADVHRPAAVAAAAAAAAHQTSAETQVPDGAGMCTTLQGNISECTRLLQLPGA
jgi:phage-related minor tail protein